MNSELTLKELQNELLDILLVIDKFCRLNNIKYSLTAGTLLGAVRHKGFIPWDDDIDITMLREDYIKFINSFNDFNPDYKIYCFENNPKWKFIYGKVFYEKSTLIEKGLKRNIKLKINIDIFPLDNLNNDYDFPKNHLINAYIINYIMMLKRQKLSFISGKKKIASILCQILPFVMLSKKIIQYSKCFNEEKDPYVTCYSDLDLAKYIMKESEYKDLIELEFMGHNFFAIRNYDTLLKKFYGDYMKLPPEEDRINKHGSKAFLLGV